jgi:TPR repeat protein
MNEHEAKPYERAQRLLDEKRYSEALVIYERLASAGDPRCQVALGWLYYEGLGVTRDPEKALSLFQSAANLGLREGAFYCGRCFLQMSEYDEALKWFRASAAQNFGPALLWLGLAHVRGLGVAIDFEKGVHYLERAASTGNFAAQRELSVLMMKGKLGAWRIPLGLIRLVSAVTVAILVGIAKGHSDRLMG